MSRYADDALGRARAKAVAGKPSRNGRPAAGKAAAADGWPEHQRGDAWEPPPEPKPAAAAASTALGFRWSPIDAAAFEGIDYRPNWLCRGVLVDKQVAIIGGAQKTLKTTLAIDLGISLAAGVDFLGTFPCPVRRRVVLLSGESGPYVLQETCRRICAAKGIGLPDLTGYFGLQFRLPQLSVEAELAELQAGIARDGIEVLLLDPLYLALLAGGTAKAESLYDTGPLLLQVAEACLTAGATPCLLHHARKGSGREGEPIELTDLAYSGVAEFARQWLLISRREKYEPGTGVHRLWLSVGGSVGHGGLHAIDVDEGRLADDFIGRQWQVEVQTPAEAREAVKDAKDGERQQIQRTKDQEDERAVLDTIDGLDKLCRGVSVTQVRESAPFSKDRVMRAIERLCVSKTLERASITVTIGSEASRTVNGVRRVAETDD